MRSIERTDFFIPALVNTYAPDFDIGQIGYRELQQLVYWATAGLLLEGYDMIFTVYRLRDKSRYVGELNINMRNPGECTLLTNITTQLFNMNQSDTRRPFITDFLEWGTKLR